MKLLLSYAVTIATLSQVPLMSKGKNPFSLNAVVWAFNFQAYSRGGKKSLLGVFLRRILLLTQHAADREAVSGFAPGKELLPSSTQAQGEELHARLV